MKYRVGDGDGQQIVDVSIDRPDLGCLRVPLDGFRVVRRSVKQCLVAIQVAEGYHVPRQRFRSQLKCNHFEVIEKNDKCYLVNCVFY